MNNYFPITTVLHYDLDSITDALTARSYEIQKTINSQSYLHRLTLVSLKILGLAAGVVTVASVPVAAFTFSLIPLSIAAVSFSVGIACLAFCTLFDPQNPGEANIKSLWGTLFQALRQGNGSQILQACQELAAKKRMRPVPFNHCIGHFSQDITPFLHKANIIGYLLLTLEGLRRKDEEQVHMNLESALSYFEGSGFSEEVKNFALALRSLPHSEISRLLEKHSMENDLYTLDYLFFALKSDNKLLKKDQE